VVTSCRKSLFLDLAVVAALYLFCLSMAVIGVDYGEHWDEMPNKVTYMKGSVDKGLLLPGNYEYPSLWFDISVLSLVPDFARGAAKQGLRGRDAYGLVLDGQSYLKDKFTQEEFVQSFLLRNRIIFAAISLAAVFGVYLMARFGAGDRLAALAASALCAASFEYFYHAKFFATDSIMAAFAVLSGGILAIPAVTRIPGLIYLGTIAAALACGSKYPGGVFLLTPLLCTAFFTPGYGLREKCRMALACLGVFAAAFLVTTPGAIFEPVTFVHDLQYQMNHYKLMGHGPNTILPGGDHLAKMAEYLSLFALSPYLPVAAGLTGLAGLGLVASLAKRRWRVLLLLAAPALYAAFFTTQRVMIVRNYMVVVPFLALLAGLGLSALFELFGKRVKAAAWGLAALFAAVVVANLAYVAATSFEVANYASADLAAGLNAYLAGRPDKTYYLAPSLRSLARVHANVTTDRRAKADGLIYDMRDDEGRLRRNKADLVLDVIGPHDVNMDYYNDWIGLDRILVCNPKYWQSTLAYSSLPRRPVPDTPWNADYVHIFFEDGLDIVFDGPVRAKSLDLSLAKDGRYRFEFFAADRLLDQVTVNSPQRRRLNDDSLAEMTLAVPPGASQQGFTRLRIVPAGGGGQYSLGHLRLAE
jgi:hypothetical protein